MKRTLITIITLISTLYICNAGISLVWEKDLSTYMSEGDDVQLLRIANDSICVAINKGNSQDILVYNSDGTNQLYDTISSGGLEFFMISSVPNHFAVNLDGTLRLYELQGETYTVVTNMVCTDFTGLAYSSINSKYFYTIEGTRLKKFKMDMPSAKIDGAVASGINGSNFILNWESETGVQYQIQSSVNLTNWVDVGNLITGTGTSLSWANALTNSQSFFRIITK